MPHPLLENMNERVLTVEEYLELVNELLTPLRVSVEGEVTDLKILPQWVFFALKDAESGSILRCGLHSGQYRRLGVNLEEGMALKVDGYGKIAAKSGNFGFWVSKIEPVGEGALRRAYELLLKKLQAEGLFERKRELPAFIDHVGVISSRNGVVIQDLLKNLHPLGIRVDFLHSGVEGADSASELLQAIEYFNTTKQPPQVLVLIRGGGSLESLQGFNNESVVRALHASPIPVLVGIGHDVDAPIATLVADWSASTPTAVAHVINASWEQLTTRMPQLADSILRACDQRLRNVHHHTDMLVRGIHHALARIFGRYRTHEATLRHAWARIPIRLRDVRRHGMQVQNNLVERMNALLRSTHERTDSLERILSVSDPQRVLQRGYSLVYGPGDTLVRSVKDVRDGDGLKTRLSDGTIESTIIRRESH